MKAVCTFAQFLSLLIDDAVDWKCAFSFWGTTFAFAHMQLCKPQLNFQQWFGFHLLFKFACSSQTFKQNVHSSSLHFSKWFSEHFSPFFHCHMLQNGAWQNPKCLPAILKLTKLCFVENRAKISVQPTSKCYKSELLVHLLITTNEEDLDPVVSMVHGLFPFPYQCFWSLLWVTRLNHKFLQAQLFCLLIRIEVINCRTEEEKRINENVRSEKKVLSVLLQ